MGRQMGKRLKPSRPIGIILEKESFHGKTLEELDGDTIITSFGKVTRAHEVAWKC